MAAISPEKKASLRKALDKAKPSLDKMKKLSAEEETRWNKEIAGLESRVHTAAVEIDLGNGVSIAVRTCLLSSEGRRLDELEEASRLEKDPQKKAEMAAESLEIITASPLITKKWILDNQDKYSPADVLRVLLGYMEVRTRERTDSIMKLRSAATFRPVESGPELRALPSLYEGDRPA